jgi:hypothetical protein
VGLDIGAFAAARSIPIGHSIIPMSQFAWKAARLIFQRNASEVLYVPAGK